MVCGESAPRDREVGMADGEGARFVPVSEVMGEFRRGGVTPQRHCSTGIAGLDDVLGGGLYPGIVVLGAVPGMGKSTLALQIAAEVAKCGTPVLFYSLEMPSDRVVSKLLNREIHLRHPESDLTSDWLLREESHVNGSDSDWELVAEAQASVDEDYAELYVRDCASSAFSAVSLSEDVMRFVEEKKESPVVIVDYLQYLAPDENQNFLSDKQRTDASVKELKSLALRLKMPVVTISSLNRNSYGKPLKMDSFKETGGIEYTASVVFGLELRNSSGDMEQDLGREPRQLELKCLKQRYGRAGSSTGVELDFYASRDVFVEKGTKMKATAKTKPAPQASSARTAEEASSGARLAAGSKARATDSDLLDLLLSDEED